MQSSSHKSDVILIMLLPSESIVSAPGLIGSEQFWKFECCYSDFACCSSLDTVSSISALYQPKTGF